MRRNREAEEQYVRDYQHHSMSDLSIYENHQYRSDFKQHSVEMTMINNQSVEQINAGNIDQEKRSKKMHIGKKKKVKDLVDDLNEIDNPIRDDSQVESQNVDFNRSKGKQDENLSQNATSPDGKPYKRVPYSGPPYTQ